MQSKITTVSDPDSKAANLLPVVRGMLARSTEIEGRPDRVVLGFDPNLNSNVSTYDAEDLSGIKDAFLAGASEVAVAGVGLVTLESLRNEQPVRDLDGQVAVITGGAGGLGFSVASELADQGARVALLDIAEEPVKAAAEKLNGIGLSCDVTNPVEVDQCVAKIVLRYGGIDVLISNAGAAHQGSLLELEDEHFQKAFALNFWSHHYVARNVVRVMQRQATGGALVFNVSKQAVNPGPDFAAYGTPKAALMALMRQYAVEHGKDGITSNAVNADRIRTGLMTDQMVEERSKARGLTPEEYMRGNLVKREVTGKDVAEAFVHLAKARTSTGAVLTVDGGNVGAMMR